MANVFYSIRPEGAGAGNDLKVACNISISSGVATFSVAQTGDIGVGCYVSSANTAGYISEMTDSTHAKIITATGGTHADVSSEALGAIYHPYASISAAMAGSGDASHLNTTDLTSGDGYNLFWPCYGATADGDYFHFSSFTTDSTHKIIVYTPHGGTESINDWRHEGVWSDTKFAYVRSSSDIQTISVSNMEFVGIQFKGANGSTWRDAVRIQNANNVVIDSCIITTGVADPITDYHRVIRVAGTSTGTLVKNSVLYNGYNGIFQELSSSSDVLTIYNCTITGCGTGVCKNTSTGTFIVKNCTVFNNTDDFYGSSTMTVDHCATDDAVGTNAVDLNENASGEWAAAFTDYASGDFSLKSGSDLIDAGTDLSAVMDSVDIIGTSRPQGDAWDVGAFEYVEEEGGLKIPIAMHHYNLLRSA